MNSEQKDAPFTQSAVTVRHSTKHQAIAASTLNRSRLVDPKRWASSILLSCLNRLNEQPLLKQTMSQDASARTKLLQPSSDASPFSAESLGSDVTESASFPVESYADRLMDDLFGDVERLLDSGTMPSEPVRLEPLETVLAAPKRSSFVDLVSPLMRRSEVEPPSALDEQDADALLVNRNATERSLAQQPLSESVSASVRSYDRLLLGVGCLSLLTVLAVWLLSQYTQRQAAPVAIAPPATNAVPSTADNQFVNYLQQALKAIDQQQSGSTTVGANGAPTSLPTVALPGTPTIQNTSPTGTTTPGTTTRPATGLSRLYVPVYQVPQAGQPGSPSVTPLPSVKAPTAVRQPIPLSVPGIAKKLVGVLELGDRSAALIEINGVTQRYRIGESIATSGWTLVEVSQNQAVIRRNGEVRSIFTGQSF
ncbi:MAG: hypothetical protein H7Z11_00630 [Verrucomicrobia bacterium]|nr:hypothetical protein [Leptolyngbya sp. ES-bin-22]